MTHLTAAGRFTGSVRGREAPPAPGTQHQPPAEAVRPGQPSSRSDGVSFTGESTLSLISLHQSFFPLRGRTTGHCCGRCRRSAAGEPSAPGGRGGSGPPGCGRVRPGIASAPSRQPARRYGQGSPRTTSRCCCPQAAPCVTEANATVETRVLREARGIPPRKRDSPHSPGLRGQR